MSLVMEQIGKSDGMADQSIIGAEYMTPESLAKDLGRSVRTLDRWHALRIGPPRVTIGRVILYRRAAILEWLRAREKPTQRVRSR